MDYETLKTELRNLAESLVVVAENANLPVTANSVRQVIDRLNQTTGDTDGIHASTRNG